MKKVQQQLNEYRRTRKNQQQEGQGRSEQVGGGGEPMSSSSNADGHELSRAVARPSSGTASSDAQNWLHRNAVTTAVAVVFAFLLSFDLLDIYPMRKWREFCAEKPLQCWVLTTSLWLAGQLLAAHAQFGFVYFVLSILLLLVLNLGVRHEGELSAYSVFNPNCERLPGQLTGEHFERDMLFARHH